MKNYYNILGVDKNAAPEEIKLAYRKLAAKHHPDRGGDTAKFQEIQEAYDTLIDPEKKSNYDNPRPHPNEFSFYSNGFPPEFEEIFSNFPGAFGGMFRQQRQQRNRNLNLKTSITLEDAFYGKEIITNLKLPSGRDQTLEIKIPPGIQDGTTLRLSGIGDDTIPNLPRGDIHLTVHVQPNREFIRQGDDLIKQLDLNCLDAILGKQIIISTIDKKEIELKITSGTQHGQILGLQNLGMPNIKNNTVRGRLLIQINIIIPTNLSEDKKTLIKQALLD